MKPLRQANVPPPITPGGIRGRLLADLWQDLRLATRMLRKQAGLTAAVALTLALGIGANGAIFALVDTVLLRDLPLPNSERLMTIWERTETSQAGLVSPANLVDWKQRNRSFDEIAGFIPRVASMVMSSPDGAETIPRQWVTAGVFRALGINAIVGRTFLPDDDLRQAKVVVLAEAFWRTRFNSDSSIVGQSIRLDGQVHTVVGVVPQGARILGRTSIWALIPILESADARGSYWFNTVARLKPGVSLNAAQDEMASIATSLAREYPATNEGRGVTIQPMRDVVLGSELRRTSLLFLGVVGFVLLICFANIANLLLTRTAARSNELAVRSVLGADRGRLLRQFWTENLVLSLLGGLVGLLVAGALLRVAPFVVPTELLPSGIALDFDSRIVVFCAAAAVIVGLLFSLASASQVVELASAERITPGSRTVTDRSSKTRELLVVGQIATAAALLYCAGLLSRTLLELDDVDPGYGAESVLSMMVDPLSASYPSPELLLQFYAAIESEVEGLPGVSNAAWTSALPFGPSMMNPAFFEIAGVPSAMPAQRPTAELHVVSGDYFRTLDLPLLAGRTFDARDMADGVPVCIVNDAFARVHPGSRPVIGERVSRWQTNAADEEAAVCEIVGVAGNTRREPDEVEEPVQIYLPLTQLALDDIYFVVRPTSGDAEALASSVRAAIARVDREQLVSVRDVMTLEEIGREATSGYRFRARLVVAFAGLALLLAMVGLFGILAYSVQRGWREYGVRMALGATAGDVTRLIARGAARLVVPGVLVGTGLALGIGQLLGAMLFGIQPFDPATLTAVFIVLVVTAAAAIAGPALRATRLDPAGALRIE
jgi:putative ABC transport system permease protein